MSQPESDQEAVHLEKCLINLADCEQKMDKAEKEAEIFRINKTQKIYEERRQILSNIPQFWYIVLAENDDFAEYITVDDLQYLETITDVYVHYKVADTNDIEHFKDFTITIAFKDSGSEEHPIIQTQEVTKHFATIIEDGEEKITSEPVDVIWPKALDNINPKLIKTQSKGQLSVEDKKNYRSGMKSFFAWFNWTGTNPGKEFRNGEDLARLISENLFPYAVKYYTEALPNGEQDEEEDFSDSEEGEELDISDEDEENEKKRSADNVVEHESKKSKK